MNSNPNTIQKKKKKEKNRKEKKLLGTGYSGSRY
jgi:hypothetical protein